MAAAEYVAKLHDREAIKELRYRYGRSIDSRSWDEFLDLFTDYVGGFTGREDSGSSPRTLSSRTTIRRAICFNNRS